MDIQSSRHNAARHFSASFFFLLLLSLLLSSGAVWGQSTASVRGIVSDPQGAVIPNAQVTIHSAETDFQRSLSSGAGGEYEFLQLKPGVYKLSVSAPGFERYENPSLHLLVNTPATLNVALTLGKQTDVVSVSEEAPPLNQTDASLGIAFSEKQVKEIPLEGRNVPDLLTLQAGVVYTGNRPDVDRDSDTRSGAVNGARSDQSNVTLDGVDVNDQGNGYAFTSVLPVTLDSVQEFRVTTTNYNADEGRSSGAQVALVTKSGTNHFHGSLYEYLRNTATSANDYFVKLAEITQGQANEPPKLIRNIYGGSLGGPIVKDRLFFFANYEGTRQREEESVVRTIPSATLRQGILQYQDVNGGVTTLSPQQITGLDPLGLGPNPAVLSYFKSFPLPNDNSVGDGLNFSGYRFRGPISTNKDYYIARADYKIDANGNHNLFWRGALQNIAASGAPFLPGQAPENTAVDYSKGFAVGYTAVLSPALVNNFRWGFTRQSVGNIGNSDQPYIHFRGMDQGVTRSNNFQMPVNNFVNDLSWTKGKHTFQFGTNIAIIRDPRESTLNSFSDGIANAAWLDTGGFAASNSSPLNPANGGFPGVSDAFANSYDFPMIAMLGMVTEVDATYNFGKSGNLLPQGAPIKRNFAEDYYEWYAQDTYRIKPNLTVIFGLRYSLYSPPWETNGLQASPSQNLGTYFSQREAQMQQGIPSNTDSLLTFDLAGPANGKSGFYNWDKANFAPRISVAWSPEPQGWLKKVIGDKDKTVVRGGFGIVYDNIGLSLLNTFDQNSSTGFATTLTNPAQIQTVLSSPRLTSVNTVPTTNNDGQVLFIPPPSGKFPQTPPTALDSGGFQIAWGNDASMRTPRSYTYDVSIGRELPKNFSLELSYVGRYSQNLLTQADLALPLNLTDKGSGITYFQAATRMSQLYRQGLSTNQINASVVGPTAKYWQDMTQQLKKGGAYSLYCNGGSTTNVLQAVYDVYSCFPYNDTSALNILDVYGIGDANLSGVNYFPTGGQYSYYNPQYSSLYAWRTIGASNYNALQVNLRRHFSNGVQFDLNYTFSKSLDISSDAARIGPYSGLGGQVINSFSPNQLRAVSDFDTPHQINANFIAELPFGRDKAFARNAGPVLDALIGGWQLSGLVRWTSGFPVTVDNGYYFPTNWEEEGNAFTNTTPQTGTTKFGDGTVSMFKNGNAAVNDFSHPFPGGSGARNTFRGDGFAGTDLSLSKRWKMPFAESNSVQLRWEVFNVFNQTRFNVQSNRPEVDQVTSFGNYTGLLTQPRVMQFALRYAF